MVKGEIGWYVWVMVQKGQSGSDDDDDVVVLWECSGMGSGGSSLAMN